MLGFSRLALLSLVLPPLLPALSDLCSRMIESESNENNMRQGNIEDMVMIQGVFF